MKYNILVIILAIFLSSCNDWLEIDPKSEVGEDILFSDGDGYFNALNGIYLNISSYEFYGREMSWGLIDVLAQYYDCSRTTYVEAEKYNYDYKYLENVINAIWSKGYNTIANTNNLIEHIEKADPEIFKVGLKDMIHGEALAVRAMMHFDLVRLFGKSPVAGDGESIPFYDEYNKDFHPLLPTSKILENVVKDLLKARKLVATVDTTESVFDRFKNPTFRFTTRGTSEKEVAHRGCHLNYFATTALLARVYLYKGDKENAYKYAKEIIKYVDSGDFEFTPGKKLWSSNHTSKDVKLSYDLLFAAHKLEVFNSYYDYTNNFPPMFLENMESLFNPSDYRSRYLFTKNIFGKTISYKYQISTSETYNTYTVPLIPLIRLSEMYYIASEAIYDTNPTEAIDLLNFVRDERGISGDLPLDLEKNEFIEEVIKEYRKDFIGEGQAFFAHKRLNHSIQSGQSIIPPENINFVLPIPKSETNTGTIK